MIPPRVDGCRPETGSVLYENVVWLFGNGFKYISDAPVVMLMPTNSKVDIDWRYQYEVDHPPAGQTGGAMPSGMQIWISKLESGARYRLEYHGFTAEFTAGSDIRYQIPPEQEE